MQHFCIYEQFLTKYHSTISLIWLLFLPRFSSNVFLQPLKVSHIHFILQNVPAKREETFIWEKNVLPKRDPGFMKVGSLLGEIIHFHTNRFWFSIEFFYKVRSHLTEALNLLACFFLHINTPQIRCKKCQHSEINRLVGMRFQN